MAAPAKLISTSIGFQDPTGKVVASGTLMLTLSQTATVTATGGQVTTEPIYFPLDVNGKITSGAIWFSDELSPSGTIYYGTVYSSNGCRMVPGLEKLQYSITGASFDLATAVQASSASPSYSGAVLLTPTGNQVITTGNLTLTTGSLVETANAVTGTGGLVRKTSPTLTSPTLTTPTLGVATATTINGVTIPTATDTAALLAAAQTLTIKRITPRVQTAADAASITPTSDTADITVQANTQISGTLTINAPTGTPTDGQKLVIRIKSTNAQTYSFNATYAFSASVIAPTTLGAGKTDYIGCMWDATNSKWDVVAVDQGH